jgi:hypothetical protein
MKIMRFEIKLLFTALFFYCLFIYSELHAKIPDGLYLILRIEEDSTAKIKLKRDEAIVRYSPLFDDYNQETHHRIIINSYNFVPIVLRNLPEKEIQPDGRKKLLLTLSGFAAVKLKKFSEKNLNKLVAIVVDGKVLTHHVIKAVLTEGLLQITRCTDNACELLYEVLKENVVDKK